MRICQAEEIDFESIKHHIAKLELDDRELSLDQFLVAKSGSELLGFGRIRKHKGCDEFCTLGIINVFQNKGVGKSIVQEIIKISTQPLYLVCIIPSYFKPFGFFEVSDYPVEMLDKLSYCTQNLSVPEPYVVMKHGR